VKFLYGARREAVCIVEKLGARGYRDVLCQLKMESTRKADPMIGSRYGPLLSAIIEVKICVYPFVRGK
jgi:hypothetical protein